PVRATLQRLDPQLEEAARSMGRTPAETFRTVVLPQLRPALAAGSVLVALYVMSDFGAVSIMRFESFTTEIYVQYRSSFDRTGAASLAAVLVLLMLVLIWLNGRVHRRQALYRSTPDTARPARPYPLGRWRWPALAFCAAVVLAGRALPVGVLVYWTSKGISAGAMSSELVG